MLVGRGAVWLTKRVWLWRGGRRCCLILTHMASAESLFLHWFTRSLRGGPPSQTIIIYKHAQMFCFSSEIGYVYILFIHPNSSRVLHNKSISEHVRRFISLLVTHTLDDPPATKRTCCSPVTWFFFHNSQPKTHLVEAISEWHVGHQVETWLVERSQDGRLVEINWSIGVIIIRDRKRRFIVTRRPIR